MSKLSKFYWQTFYWLTKLLGVLFVFFGLVFLVYGIYMGISVGTEGDTVLYLIKMALPTILIIFGVAVIKAKRLAPKWLVSVESDSDINKEHN